jgi:hypothetical protein
MKRNSFSVFFFIKKTKLLSNGEAPIRLRIKVNGIAVESQIKRSVPPNQWDQATESSKGRDRKASELNEYIRMLKLSVDYTSGLGDEREILYCPPHHEYAL